ncbi:MAG: DMT family transporter [Planctomycetota bacterium]
MHLRTLVGTLLALCAFAANSLLTRRALGDGAIGASAFTAIRLGSGALVLALLAGRGRLVARTLRPRGFGGPLALFLYALPFSFAYVRIGAATGALVLFGSVQATMLATAVRAGERPRALAWLGFGIALVGLAWLVLPNASRPDVAGTAALALAGVAWAAYTLLGRREQDPVAANLRSFVWATPLALAALAIAPDANGVTARGAMLAAISGAITSGLGYALWYRVLPQLGVARAAFAQLAVPAIAALGAVTMLGEPFPPPVAGATFVVLGGTALALAAKHGRVG